ncbi:hypothetical protein COOONC_28591 [Cooperia oncophora]
MLSDWISDNSIVRCDRARRTGGGVAMLIRKTVNYTTILSESFHKGYEFLALDFSAPELSRPPSTPLHITEQLAKAISDLSVASCPVIVIGDFNTSEIDWAQWNPNRENTHPLSETFAYHGFSQYVKEATRVLTNDQHLINNISINSALGHSDHSSISLEITASLPPCVPVFKRLLHKCDISRVRSYLSSILWVESFETLTTVDDKYSMFLLILNTIDQYVIWALVYQNKRNLPEYLPNMSEHKECLFQYAKLTGDWVEYTRFSLVLTKRLMKFNRNVEKKIVEAKDKQRLLKFVRSRLREKSQFTDLRYEGRLLLNDSERPWRLQLSEVKHFNKITTISPHFRPLSLSLLMKWPCSYSTTPDRIPFPFIRNVAQAIAFPLSYLYNQSIMHSQVP